MGTQQAAWGHWGAAPNKLSGQAIWFWITDDFLEELVTHFYGNIYGIIYVPKDSSLCCKMILNLAIDIDLVKTF